MLIFKAKEEVKKNLIRYMMNQVVEMKTAKKAYMDQFQNMIDNGHLLEEDADDLNNFIAGWSMDQQESISNDLQQLLSQYAEIYTETLSLLRNRVM